jgi:hypothetical protein
LVLAAQREQITAHRELTERLVDLVLFTQQAAVVVGRFLGLALQGLQVEEQQILVKLAVQVSQVKGILVEMEQEIILPTHWAVAVAVLVLLVEQVMEVMLEMVALVLHPL